MNVCIEKDLIKLKIDNNIKKVIKLYKLKNLDGLKTKMREDGLDFKTNGIKGQYIIDVQKQKLEKMIENSVKAKTKEQIKG